MNGRGPVPVREGVLDTDRALQGADDDIIDSIPVDLDVEGGNDVEKSREAPPMRETMFNLRVLFYSSGFD